MNIQTILKYPGIFGVAFLVTYFLMPQFMRLARKWGIVARPGERHIHRRPIPCCGGWAVFVGFHAACAVVFLMPWVPFRGQFDVTWWGHFAIASSLLLLVGVLDDKYDLRPILKLTGQVLVALLAYAFDMRAGQLLGMHLPPAIDLLVTVAWFLFIINAFNLIDGIDGLATGLAAIAAAGLCASLLFRHYPGDALVMLALLGTCLAFLRYNFNPARAFLGDGGSMFLGFTLAAAALGTGSKGTTLASIVVPLLAVGVPMFDTLLAIWRRTLRSLFGTADGNGKRGHVFKGDLDHLHHRLIKSGLSHRRAATGLYFVSLFLVATGLLTQVFRADSAGIILLAFVVGTYVVVKHLARVELWDSGALIANGMRRPAPRVIAFMLYPPLDLLMFSLALLMACHLQYPDIGPIALKKIWVARAPVWIGIPFIFLCLAQTYNRVWSRARISEFVFMAMALLGATIVVVAVESLTLKSYSRELALPFVLFTTSSLLLISGLRAFPRTVQDCMALMHRRHHGDSVPNRNVLIYGASFRGILFMRALSFDPIRNDRHHQIVGLLDDETNLHGRLVHGFRVFGGIKKLEEVIEKETVHEIVLAALLPEDRFRELLEVTRRHDVAIKEWRTILTPIHMYESEPASVTEPAARPVSSHA